MRETVQIVPGVAMSEGAGVRIARLVGTPALQMLDPFLMLDHFDSDDSADYLAGFPDHPHRGFETVTYMLEGRMRHADNKGHAGVIETGGVQWMRAGRGIVHSEMPEQQAGRMRGFQLWVNLPARMKMSAPGYQEFDAMRMGRERRADGVELVVIAGSTSTGVAGPVAAPHVDARYFDVVLGPGALLVETVPEDHAAMVVVYEGEVTIGGAPRRINGLALAVLGSGPAIHIAAGGAGARCLLIAGRPLGEPVAWGGPFVMNTRAEVMQAFADYQAGRF
jgi:redox-sensitive bicupin YhaK (pirin superfamily)